MSHETTTHEPMEQVKINTPGGGIVEVVINRPSKLNALNAQVLEQLKGELGAMALDPRLKAVIITGAGDRAFVAGADIEQMSGMTQEEAKHFSLLGHAVMNAIENIPVPVIAAVNGFALGGGCEIVLACDIVFASEKAKFGQPEVKLGLIPGFGGTVRLPRKVGEGRALELLTSGRQFGAAEAKQMGLVQFVTEPQDLMQTVYDWASGLSKTTGPASIRKIQKGKLIRDRSYEEALSFEVEQFASCFETHESREGMSAFLEKRAPQFR